MRISAQQGTQFVPVDETFNKHILFHSGGLTANITYTGTARWASGGKTVNLYDVISKSIADSGKASMKFGPVLWHVTQAAIDALKNVPKASVEMHVVGYHKDIPWPFIGVISTYRTARPWPKVEGEILELPKAGLLYSVEWISTFPMLNDSDLKQQSSAVQTRTMSRECLPFLCRRCRAAPKQSAQSLSP
jgi:hypothetical protein